MFRQRLNSAHNVIILNHRLSNCSHCVWMPNWTVLLQSPFFNYSACRIWGVGRNVIIAISLFNWWLFCLTLCWRSSERFPLPTCLTGLWLGVPSLSSLLSSSTAVMYSALSLASCSSLTACSGFWAALSARLSRFRSVQVVYNFEALSMLKRSNCAIFFKDK